MANYQNNYGAQGTWQQNGGYPQNGGWQQNGGYAQNPQNGSFQQQGGGAQNSQGRKMYSFLDVTRAITTTGKQVIRITMIGDVNRVQVPKQVNGMKVIEFSMPIYNRSDRIQNVTGVAPETNNGLCWARATVWQGTADRFEKFIAKHPSPVIAITGNLSMNHYTDRNGNQRVSLEIAVNDFELVREKPAKSGNGNQQQSGPQNPPQNSPWQAGSGQPNQQNAPWQNAGQQPAPQAGTPWQSGQPQNTPWQQPNGNWQGAGQAPAGQQSAPQSGNPWQSGQSQSAPWQPANQQPGASGQPAQQNTSWQQPNGNWQGNAGQTPSGQQPAALGQPFPVNNPQPENRNAQSMPDTGEFDYDADKNPFSFDGNAGFTVD